MFQLIFLTTQYQEQNEHLKSALAKSEDNHFSLYQRSKSMQDQLNKYKVFNQ